MFTVRIQGRNDAGVGLTAELLAAAAAADGRRLAISQEAAADPSRCLCAITDDDPRSANAGPAGAGQEADSVVNALLMQDTRDVAQADAFAGLNQESYLLVDSARGFGELGAGERVRELCQDRMLIVPTVRLVPGPHTSVARSACMLGGLAAISGEITLSAVQAAARHRVPGPAGQATAEAALRAYEFVQAMRLVLAA